VKRLSWSTRPRQLSFWLRVCTFFGVLLIVACAYWVEANSRNQVLQSAANQARTQAKSLAQQASDTFQMADLALISLSRLLGDQAPTRSQRLAIEADMAQLLMRVPRIRSLDYFEESGWLLATSAPASVARNASRTNLFRTLRAGTGASLVVGAPVRNEAAGRWEIVAGHRVTKPDGSFGGMLTATVDASYFSDFYATFSGSRDGHAALMTTEGIVLSRYPFVEEIIGTTIPESPILRALWRGETSGSIMKESPVTGDERLQAFTVVAGQPMVVVFTLPKDVILAPWHADMLARLPIALCVLALVIGIGLRLASQAERRQQVEAGLVELSRTDALTGLLNRRDFNETLPLAWARCRDRQQPLSLLMIDVDCFKLFNDTYGHQTGDTCLQLISLAVQKCVSPDDHRVIRYGGEEIAVVLPHVSESRAGEIAEAIRQAVVLLAIQHTTSTVADVVTVSIGASTEDWQDPVRLAPSELLNDADRALYRAKIGGRNRVVADPGGLVDPDFSGPLPQPSLRVISRG
jgi:diguanylate cyclase (GGDEF)-like protein